MNKLVLKWSCVCFLLLISFSFSQNKKENSYLNTVAIKGEELCKKDKIFCEVFSFFKEKKYDSCYVYSETSLLKTKDQEGRDFLNFIQGISASRKNMFKKALQNFMSISNDTIFNGANLFELGNVYYSLKKYEEALSCYFDFEKKYVKKYDSKTERILYFNIGRSFLFKENYSQANLYFDKGVALLDKKDTLDVINSKMSLANVYYNQYLDDKAIPLFKETYDLAKLYSNLETKSFTAKNMAVVEKNRKRYKESIDYYNEYDKWKDSIWNRDKIWELTEKDKQLAVAQKQQEIAIQDEQIKRQKVVQTGLLLGASALLLFIGGLGYFYRKLKKQKQLITEQKEELQTANKTKDYLFSVVSHDLRTPINTIKKQHKKLLKSIDNKEFAVTKELAKQAVLVTESTGNLLNNVLHWSLEQGDLLNFQPEAYPLKTIIEHVLFDYEELAESKEIRITTTTKESLLASIDKESVKIVLRNLMDNAVKYMGGSGSIQVTLAKESVNQALITIQDTGKGIPLKKLQEINALSKLSPDKIDRTKGIGLGMMLCFTLIKKNNGTLFFESEEGKGTKAIVLLPLT